MNIYINKMFSLQEMALAQVAINLCQENTFREIALNLEKPTYGGFIYTVLPYEPVFFVSDPETLSIWAKVKDDKRLHKAFQRSRKNEGEAHLMLWHDKVHEQCGRLTEEMPLPDRFKQKIHPWIRRIAMEYLTYSRRLEMFFEVSRYFLMDSLTIGDWKGDGQIDEEKVARRLLEDERLTVLQRYQVACVYCLEVHILQLWNRLTPKEKQFFIKGVETDLNGDCYGLVSLWSRYMNGNVEECELWTEAVSEGIHCGNLWALKECWKRLKHPVQQQIVIDSAVESYDHCRRWEENRDSWKQLIVSPLVPSNRKYIEHFTLPSYYNKLLVFFLSQMDEEQQLEFFTYAFDVLSRDSVTEFLLDWPYQDNFLPTMKRLWGIMPKEEYNKCLIALAKKYSLHEENANCDYDYRSLLVALWEETPEEYKNYVLFESESSFATGYGDRPLLCTLLERSPFQEEDEMLFKLIFRDQKREKITKENFLHLLLELDNRKFMCFCLILQEKWSFLNWLLEEWIPQEEIASFKQQFIQSHYGSRLCFNAFEENRKKLVEDVFDWSFESATEKAKFKDNFISDKICLDACESFLRRGKFAAVEQVVNFYLSSVQKRKKIRLRFAHRTCVVLLQSYTHDSWVEDDVLEQMDRIIAWSVNTEKEIRKFKKNVFSRKGIAIHYKLVFIRRVWEKAERFYQWFALSPEEIKQLKWDTVFTPKAIELYHNKGLLFSIPPLSWCLTDEETVMNFKHLFEEKYTYAPQLMRYNESAKDAILKKKQDLDLAVTKLIKGFRKEVRDETSSEGVFVKDKNRKRSSVEIENEPSSTHKRSK